MPQGNVLLEERLLSFADAARFLPAIGGRKLSTTTIWRWARKGVRGVRLEVRRVGSRSVTSIEALDRFTAALAALDDAPPMEPTTRTHSPRQRTDTQRRRDVAEANARLAADGI